MLSWEETLIRLLLASLFGGLIGLERERKEWAAGLRTHMMVCTGSCLIIIVSAYAFSDVIKPGFVVLDPSRIAAQVVSGVGFIGAGAILFSKQGTIRGLTTAAGLWTVAAIGLATGGGLYFAAGITTLVALFILWGVKLIELRFLARFKPATLRILTGANVDHAALVHELMGTADDPAEALNFERTDEGLVFEMRCSNRSSPRVEALVAKLQADPKVKEVSWSR
jgi:putative Mg2+ transporter-C (MgtC) family protein